MKWNAMLKVLLVLGGLKLCAAAGGVELPTDYCITRAAMPPR